MSLLFTTRSAVQDDYEFLFELKKAALKCPVERIFGWDEAIQRQIHQQEWIEDRPIIIVVENKPIGSYLIQKRSEELYFARFFILPEYQGMGLGNTILRSVIAQSEAVGLPITLCYLQGNWVGKLYKRFGFTITSETQEFVYMQRKCGQSD
ncbi:GNAT family N-acetyltransferase [Vibrio kasasachensis]|uniref:GNAT family N-acetyltransferase n=1 Tax=Vibrio kasasachensis TaxID=2910248 RepID=UPI003D0BF032